MKHIRPAAIASLFPLLVLSSCLGVKLDIALNQNGSGTLAVEYTIAKSIDSLGKLDGNERWNTIPVGRADFERTLSRLPDMELVSFSNKENERDLVITAKMRFASIDSLLAFLDAQGSRSALTGDAAGGSLKLTLGEGAGANGSLGELIGEIPETYTVKMSMTFPGEGNLALLDSGGTPLGAIRGSEVNAVGKTVSASIPLREILLADRGINVEFRW